MISNTDMKWSKIRLCQICHKWPGINYDGRIVCIICWPKIAKKGGKEK